MQEKQVKQNTTYSMKQKTTLKKRPMARKMATTGKAPRDPLPKHTISKGNAKMRAALRQQVAAQQAQRKHHYNLEQRL